MKWSDSADPDLIFCDNHVLIASKPAGWLTQPDDTQRLNLETFAKEWVKKEFHKPGAVFLHCIHRLDRPVSGLVLFAKTSKALSRLNEQSRANEVRRVYCAEIEGILPKKEGVIEHFLAHGEHRALVVSSSHPAAKKCILSYVVKEYKEHTTRVFIELQTGRYHQIRAQFSSVGHPIIGDVRYGAKPQEGGCIRLCCTDLVFAHPVTKEQLSFHCEAPFA